MTEENLEKKESKPFIPFAIARGITRSIAGVALGAVVFSAALTRSIVGASINAIEGLIGALGTAGTLVAHTLNFGRVQLTKIWNRAVGKDKSKDPDVSFTKNLLEKSAKFTIGKFKSAALNFSNIFSGKRDEEIKKNLSSMLTKDKDIKDQEPLLNNNDNTKNKETIENLVIKIPNTKDLIITSARLMLGMSKQERQEAENKLSKPASHQSDRSRH